MKSENPLRPLIIGEVLFDCFAEHCVLGGAPFNVAWNLRGLGLDPLLISAVGDDDRGEQVRLAMQSWGLDDSALQVAAGHATGRVDITLTAGEPSYRFWDDVAFDHLQRPSLAPTDPRFGLLYHGSLVFRSPQSRATIAEFKADCRCPVFVDINIRRPYFDPAWVPLLIEGAEHVKLNLDELRRLSPGACPETSAEPLDEAWQARRQCAAALQSRYGVQNIWLTAGEQGAAWIGPGGEFHQIPAPAVAKMVDSVGAGDAFAAMIIRGILAGRSPQDSLQGAAEFAARVCGIRGASVADPSFYSQQEIA